MQKRQQDKAHTVLTRLVERDLATIAEQMARQYHVTLIEVCSDVHNRAAVTARHHIWWKIKHTTLLSYPEIGLVWGVDNTTIHNGVRKMDRLLNPDGTPKAVTNEP